AQEERVNVLRVALQEFIYLRLRARRVAALEAYLAEAVARACVVRPVLVIDDLLIDAGGIVEATDGGVVVRESRATIGLVPVELRPGLVSVLCFVETIVDEVVACEHPAHVPVFGINFGGAAELALGLFGAARLRQKFSVLDVRERRAVVDGDGLLVCGLGFRVA